MANLEIMILTKRFARNAIAEYGEEECIRACNSVLRAVFNESDCSGIIEIYTGRKGELPARILSFAGRYCGIEFLYSVFLELTGQQDNAELWMRSYQLKSERR